MSQARGSKDYLNLLKGLNTEANPLAFPEGYTADESNFVLALEGNVRARRKGLQKYLESDKSYTSFVGENNVRNPYTYYWSEVDLILVVLQDDVYARLVILENDATYTELGVYTIYSFDSGEPTKPSFATILDGVVITVGSDKNNSAKPIFLQVNDSGNIEISEIDIYFRDFELLDDNTSISFRPNSLTDTHTYNLLNAGWYAERKNQSGNLVDPLSLFLSSTVYENPFESTVNATSNHFEFKTSTPSVLADLGSGDAITVSGMTDPTNNGTFTVDSVNVIVEELPPPATSFIYKYTVVVDEALTVDETTGSGVEVSFTTGSFPSNADIPLLGLKTDETSGEQYFDPDTLYETVLGNTEAPRGHYIYDIDGAKTRDSVLVNKKDDGSPSKTVRLKATITR